MSLVLHGEHGQKRGLRGFSFEGTSHRTNFWDLLQGLGVSKKVQQVVPGEVGSEDLGPKKPVSGLAEYPEYWD